MTCLTSTESMYIQAKTHLESLSPQSMCCLGEVLDERACKVFEPDEAINIPPLYLPLHKLCLWLLKLLYHGPQVLLI